MRSCSLLTAHCSPLTAHCLLAQPGVTSIIIGANKLSQLEDNLKAADLELTAAEIETLSATTAPAPLYPQWMIELQNEGR